MQPQGLLPNGVFAALRASYSLPVTHVYGINLKYHDQATKFRKRSSDAMEAMEATMYRSLKNLRQNFRTKTKLDLPC